jgi:hypothetical protein
MAKLHSKNFWYSTKAEVQNKYASGDAGANAGSMAKMTTSGTAAGKPAGKPVMPMKKYKREAIEACGDDEWTQTVFTSGLENFDGEIPLFLQEDVWLTQILQCAAGAIPEYSRTVHWQHGATAVGAGRRFESFGTLCKKWKLHVEAGDKLPTQTVTLFCYKTKTDEGAGTDVDAYDKLAYATTAPCRSKDVTMTIEGTTIKYQTLDVEITSVYDEVAEGGNDATLEPRLISRDVSIVVDFQDPTIDSADLVINEHNLTETTPTAIDVVITMAAPMSDTLTFANLRVLKADEEELPDHLSIHTRHLELGKGTDTTCVLS